VDIFQPLKRHNCIYGFRKLSIDVFSGRFAAYNA